MAVSDVDTLPANVTKRVVATLLPIDTGKLLPIDHDGQLTAGRQCTNNGTITIQQVELIAGRPTKTGLF